MSTPLLQTLAIGRYNPSASERVLLASVSFKISSKVGSQHVSTIQKLIDNDQFVSNVNFMITDEESHLLIYYSRDDLLLYFAVCDQHFTAPKAQKLFTEMKQRFTSQLNPLNVRSMKKNGLQRNAEPVLRDFAERYNNPNNDQMKVAMQQIDTNKAALADNVNRMLDHQEKLENIQDGSGMQTSLEQTNIYMKPKVIYLFILYTMHSY